LHEKRIGSWFSLASPIKTTAGFSIKRRIFLPAIPYSPFCHLDHRERSHWNAGEWDEEEEYARELHEFARKENWQLVFSGFADKNNCRFFD